MSELLEQAEETIRIVQRCDTPDCEGCRQDLLKAASDLETVAGVY